MVGKDSIAIDRGNNNKTFAFFSSLHLLIISLAFFLILLCCCVHQASLLQFFLSRFIIFTFALYIWWGKYRLLIRACLLKMHTHSIAFAFSPLIVQQFVKLSPFPLQLGPHHTQTGISVVFSHSSLSACFPFFQPYIILFHFISIAQTRLDWSGLRLVWFGDGGTDQKVRGVTKMDRIRKKHISVIAQVCCFGDQVREAD